MSRRGSHRGERRKGAQAEPTGASDDQHDSSWRAGFDAITIGAGYIVSFAYPLVSLPLLARVLGAHDLGRFMLSLALVQLVVFVADFGFGKSAVRRISVAETREERSQIVFATTASILLLWTVAAFTLMSIVMLTPLLRQDWVMYLVGVLLVGAGVLYPDWLLQGMGRIRSFTLIMVVSRLTALVLLVLTVRTPGELVLPMLWQQFPLALSAVIAWIMVLFVWRDIRLMRTSGSEVRDAISDSAPMFVAGLANLTISGSNTIVLGTVSTPVHIAFFGAAERFGNAVRGVMHGIVDAMLPRMTRGGGGQRTIQTAIMSGVMGAYALAGISLAVLSPLIIPWYLGDEMRGAVPVSQLIGISLLPSGVVTALFLRATAQHRFRFSARVAIVGAICHFVLLFPAGWLWGSTGAAAVAIVTETTIATLYIADAIAHRRRTRSDNQLMDATSPVHVAPAPAPAPVEDVMPPRTEGSSPANGSALPLITVVVPYYETGVSVRRTIDSLLVQTIEDIEILIIDDGSRREPVPHDLPHDARLVIDRQERNGGYASLTNHAVRTARSEWVTFVDSDDTVTPDYLERLLDTGVRTGADVVFTPMIRVSGSKVMGRGPWTPPSDVMSSRTALRALLQGKLVGTQHALFRNPRPLATVGQVYSDFDFALRHVARSEIVACVDEELYLNTVHVASATGSLRPGIWDLVALNELIRPVIEEAFSPDEAALLLHHHRDITLTQVLHTAANEREDSNLRREVTDWCRARITVPGILTQLREGRRAAAGSWSLALVSGTLHRRAYQCFDSRRKAA